MSRDAGYFQLTFRSAGASAGTTTIYWTVPAAFQYDGWSFMYESAEANTDNTVTVALAYTVDGSNFTTLKAVNSNTAGLLDSGAPLVVFRNPSNPGSAAAAWGAESAPTPIRVSEKATIRATVISAGTSTIPATQIAVFGKFLTSVDGNP